MVWGFAQGRALTSGAEEHLGPPEAAPQRMGLVEGCRGQACPSLGMQAVSCSFQMLQLCLSEELHSYSLQPFPRASTQYQGLQMTLAVLRRKQSIGLPHSAV